MKKITIHLENCYGIRMLHEELDLEKGNAIAIYAPNGSMKTSLAQAFADLAASVPSKDRYFPARNTVRRITDESGVELAPEKVFVLKPYDETFSHSEKTSTLLVNDELRKEHEQLLGDINREKASFLDAMKKVSGSKKNLEKEISSTFTKRGDNFFKALERVSQEMAKQKDEPFSDVAYDRVFDEKIVDFLKSKNVSQAIKDYIERYNELLAKSTYFKKGVFNYHNATSIAKSLSDNGFFEAKHFVTLDGKERREIKDRKDLERVIEDEKTAILTDKELKKTFDEIEKMINKNANLREFNEYLSVKDKILPQLANVDSFQEEIWKSYFKNKYELYKSLLERYQSVEARVEEIKEEAAKQRTQWEAVIDIFNDRFQVPFKLTVENRIDVILGLDSGLAVNFSFKEGTEETPVKRDDLLVALSAGEKKALYVLNIIFEVERRRKEREETVFVIDDIADSFDYKNKYAIIEYLKEISATDHFCQIILTHNFDFFRTICSRYVGYHQCLMAFKAEGAVTFKQAQGIKNVFVNDWKRNFGQDPKKRIASIPFMRNLIEYTKGADNPNYKKLTSLLHWKEDTKDLSENDLANIYAETFGESVTLENGQRKVMQLLEEQIDECLRASDGVNFENKIVLSIAIRLKAEEFLIRMIGDEEFTSSLQENQTPKLLEKFKELFPGELDTAKTIERVLLMTPENIHLNSFMYEPILDMSDGHLKKLCNDVKGLIAGA